MFLCDAAAPATGQFKLQRLRLADAGTVAAIQPKSRHGTQP